MLDFCFGRKPMFYGVNCSWSLQKSKLSTVSMVQFHSCLSYESAWDVSTTAMHLLIILCLILFNVLITFFKPKCVITLMVFPIICTVNIIFSFLLIFIYILLSLFTELLVLMVMERVYLIVWITYTTRWSSCKWLVH